MAMVSTARSFAPSTSSGSISGASRTMTKADSTSNDSFPAGLRVLVVDDDPICLLILDRMLRRCQYKVTTCGRAADALAMLRENRESFDVIISDVYMPDMDGFKLLELVGLEMGLPVIMMSANGETSAVMKGIKHGACDYLLKPVRMEELRNIWQHVVRKKWRSSTHLAVADDEKGGNASGDGDNNSSVNEGCDGMWKHGRKRRESRDDEEDADVDPEDPSTMKKPRVVWSVELHQQFVNAVKQLGIDKAVPKRILELMNVQGLTRENVASHLQKYRLYLKRISGVTHQSGTLGPSFSVSNDSSFGLLSGTALGRVGDFRGIGGSNELPSQALLAGVLGRLNQASNPGNVEKPNLLQLAALHGVDSGTLNLASFAPSYVQTALSNQAILHAGQGDANQAQLAQLGALSGIPLDKLSLGLSAIQQQQLDSAIRLGGFGQVPGATNFHQVNPTSAALMQALQQQQGGSDLLTKGRLTICSSASGGQEEISTDAGVWANASSNLNGNIGVQNPLPGQYGLPSRLGSTPGSCPPGQTTQRPFARVPDRDGECKGQQGLSTDAGVWGSSVSNLNMDGSPGNINSQLLEIGFSEAASPTSLESAYGVKTKCSLLPNHGNVSLLNPLAVSSSMSGSGSLLYGRMKDVNASLPTSNLTTAQNLGSIVNSPLPTSNSTTVNNLGPRFPPIPGMKQVSQAGQRAQGTWPGFGSTPDFVQASSSAFQSSGGSSSNQGFQLISDQEQNDFNSGFTCSNLNMDANPVKAIEGDQLEAENITKGRVENHGWILDSLSDELLSFALQQQQEGLGPD